ncbi:sporulation protein YjcZ [Anaerobacillus sp. HL2]|nr:sporulation protein YjcZ [Anaerobacillus sp. HL2]
MGYCGEPIYPTTPMYDPCCSPLAISSLSTCLWTTTARLVQVLVALIVVVVILLIILGAAYYYQSPGA